MKTTSVLLSQDTTDDIIKQLMEEMTGMGYPDAMKEQILKAAFIGYTRILGKVQRGECKRNRKRVDSLTTRRYKSLCGIKDWFRQDEQEDSWEIMPPWERWGSRAQRPKEVKDCRYIEAIMFVSHTPDSHK